MIRQSLETYLVCQSLTRKMADDAVFDEEGNISYTSRRGQSTLRPHLWGDLPSMYLAHVYADMLTQGYLVLPMEGGWIVQGGEEPYNLNENADTCTCKDYAYRGKRCQHRLMVLAHLDIKRRQAAAIQRYSR